MEAACSIGMPVDFQRTTGRYIYYETELFITTAVRTSNTAMPRTVVDKNGWLREIRSILNVD
jgi:hypothetical protein